MQRRLLSTQLCLHSDVFFSFNAVPPSINCSHAKRCFSFLNEKFFTVGCTDHLLIKKKVLKKSTPIKSWVASNWAADCKMLINGVSVACKLLYQSASLLSEKWQMMFNNNSSLSGEEGMGRVGQTRGI